MTDTIAAIATAVSNAGISIIRVSGSEAIQIVDEIFVTKGGKHILNNVASHTIHYGFIQEQDDMIDEGSVSNISNVKNLLVWYITLSPESSEDEIVNLIMDAYTDQILAIDVYSYDYTKDWKDIADHLEDIPAGFLSYLNLKQSEYNLKKRLMGNVNVTEQYQKAKSAKGSYSQISGRIGIYAIQNKKQTYIPIEWSGYGFMINNVYNN